MEQIQQTLKSAYLEKNFYKKVFYISIVVGGGVPIKGEIDSVTEQIFFWLQYFISRVHKRKWVGKCVRYYEGRRRLSSLHRIRYNRNHDWDQKNYALGSTIGKKNLTTESGILVRIAIGHKSGSGIVKVQHLCS